MKVTIPALLALSSLLPAQINVALTRLDQTATVLSAIMGTPDKGIPQDLLSKAYCIIIVPDLRTMAFLLGGKYGKGYMSCRNKDGKGWSAPGAIRIEGGSAGLQVGGSSTDLIMLVMNDRGANEVLSSKFTVGAEASIAAGPVGRTVSAQTDAQLHADILSWSRFQGLFVGVALAGATLRENRNDNAVLYGRRLGNREVMTKNRCCPEGRCKVNGPVRAAFYAEIRLNTQRDAVMPNACEQFCANYCSDTQRGGHSAAFVVLTIHYRYAAVSRRSV